MFRISAITRAGLVAVACVAVAAPSALAEPAKVQSLYGYAMSYTPTKAAKPAKVQSLYGYATSYTPTKAAKAAKVQSPFPFSPLQDVTP